MLCFLSCQAQFSPVEMKIQSRQHWKQNFKIFIKAQLGLPRIIILSFQIEKKKHYFLKLFPVFGCF